MPGFAAGKPLAPQTAAAPDIEAPAINNGVVRDL
jgi:hypothetical protein